jgi:hypothetical protein
MAAKSRAKILLDTDKDFSGKTEKLVAFLDAYVNTGDKNQSWIDAGYSENTTNQSMSLIRDNWRLVEKLIRDRIGSHVPMALNGIVELAQNASNDSVKLKALQDVMYRAGYDRPLEIVTGEMDVQKLANKDLDMELTALLARANKQALENDTTTH